MARQGNKKSDVQAPVVNWLEQLADEINVPYAPQGWYTLGEISAKLDRNRQYVVRLLESKKAEKQYFMSRRADGNRVRMIHYKL